MAKTICTVLGIAFILIGLLGFVAPGMLGMHLSPVHNVVHLVTGAAALYLGLKGTLSAARMFCLAFGAVYLLLGVVGFIAGRSAAHGVGSVPAAHHGASDSNLLALLPGSFELASMDHIVHILLGIVFLIGGFLTKADVRRAVD